MKSIRNYGKRLEIILKSQLVRMRSAVQIRSAAPKIPSFERNSGFFIFKSYWFLSSIFSKSADKGLKEFADREMLRFAEDLLLEFI